MSQFRNSEHLIYGTLVETLKTVVNTDTPVLRHSIKSIPMYELHSMGLLKLDKTYVVPRCELYRQYFQERLEISTIYFPSNK